MRASVGYANESDSHAAGRRAAAEAVCGAGVEAPALVLAFASGRLDPQAFFSGVRAEVGRAPILGGSAIGVVTGEHLSYDGHPAAVAALDLGEPLRGAAWAEGMDGDGRAVGLRLGRSFAAGGASAGAALLLFYDSIRRPATASAPPIMNSSRPLIAGIAEGLPDCPPIIGAGVLGGYDFGPTWQFCGDAVGQQRAAAALLGPSTRFVVQVMHGCTPMDGVPHVVTRAEEDVVHEIDGRPAAEAIDDVYGSRAWRSQRPVNRLNLGVVQGSRCLEPGEDAYVNRLITGVLPDGKAVRLFEPDLAEGDEIVFMLRDPIRMIESARVGSAAAVERMRRQGARPRFGLYIICGGRTAAASCTATEEAAEVQATMNRHGTPLLGFYSGVEVAPMRGESRGLDWTGVLLLLGDDA